MDEIDNDDDDKCRIAVLFCSTERGSLGSCALPRIAVNAVVPSEALVKNRSRRKPILPVSSVLIIGPDR